MNWIAKLHYLFTIAMSNKINNTLNYVYILIADPDIVDILMYMVSLAVPPNKVSDTVMTPDDSVPLYVVLLNSTIRPT